MTPFARTPSLLLGLFGLLAALAPAAARAQDDAPADGVSAPRSPDDPEWTTEDRDLEGRPIVAAEGYPLAFADRPITIADNMIRLDGEFIVSHDLPLLQGSLPTTRRTFGGMHVGAAFGITDDVEAGLSGYRMVGHRARPGTYPSALALAFNPDADFGDLRVYSKFRLFDDPGFELAMDVAFLLPIDSWFALHASAPFRARLAERFVLDAALEFLLEFNRPDPTPTDPGAESTFISLFVPIRGLLQVLPELWIAGQSGIDFYDFDLDDVVLPLTLEIGYTVNDGTAPLCDLVLGWHFPFFLMPGADGDKFPSNVWQVTLGVNGYFQL